MALLKPSRPSGRGGSIPSSSAIFEIWGVKTMVQLTEEECREIYDLIDGLSGGNASNSFLWDGSDSIDNDTDRSIAKIFIGAGVKIPDSMKELAHYQID